MTGVSADASGGWPALLIEDAGVRTLIEDLGRPGYARLGVSASGAWDRTALTLANRLVGNPEDAAGLEILLGGFRVRALRDVTVAITGTEAPLILGGRQVAQFAPVGVRAGEVLTLGTPTRGLRTYLAVRGGLLAHRVFGSLSTDPTTGIGPAPLAVGDKLMIGAAPSAPVRTADAAAATTHLATEVALRCVLGPRDDWFAAAARPLLTGTAWRVAADTDRVGTRLDGPTLPRARAGELSSEGLVRGAIQVPTSGQPLVFGPDHPTTGGYPVIGCVIGADADYLAQARPGAVVRFQIVRRPW